MKHTLQFAFLLALMLSSNFLGAQTPDTVRTGIYITSIHDIDFRQKEYTVNFWVWFNYKNPEFDFAKYIEIPQAKTINTLYSAVDTSEEGSIYVLLKLQCVMKDSWKIDNFPFNHQNLRLSIENAQFDNSTLIFAKDTSGEIYDKHALMSYGSDSLKGWHINPDSVRISVGTKDYETTFGDASLETPHVSYSTFKVKVGITRDAWGLFWKIFIGMYIAFLIAYLSFYIHIENIDARFGLSVGALFAVVGNKYIIESSLPESSTFTLVDWLHGLTLLFISSVVASIAYVLWLKKNGDIQNAVRKDKLFRKILLLVYVVSNILLIGEAT